MSSLRGIRGNEFQAFDDYPVVVHHSPSIAFLGLGDLLKGKGEVAGKNTPQAGRVMRRGGRQSEEEKGGKGQGQGQWEQPPALHPEMEDWYRMGKESG